MQDSVVTEERTRRKTPAQRASLDSEGLLTVHEVAMLLKVPVSWVYEHTRPGCHFPLPYLKLGKYLRFVATDILNYLDSARSRSHRCLR